MKAVVVITYIKKDAQGKEINLAVYGWRKYFKCDDYRLIVMGDFYAGDCDENFIVPRVPEKEGEYRPHLDICHKLFLACSFNLKYEYLIWASDDCYPVNDFTLEDVLAPKYQELEAPRVGLKHPNPWRRNLVKTTLKCQELGLPRINWVTHLPLAFEPDKLLEVIDRFNLQQESYVVENLYYNLFPPTEAPTQCDKWKFGVYFTPLDRKGLHEAFKNKTWVCNSEHGWSRDLSRALKRHYGIYKTTPKVT